MIFCYIFWFTLVVSGYIVWCIFSSGSVVVSGWVEADESVVQPTTLQGAIMTYQDTDPDPLKSLVAPRDITTPGIVPFSANMSVFHLK